MQSFAALTITPAAIELITSTPQTFACYVERSSIVLPTEDHGNP
jgi:hypothetical protein